MRHEVLVSLTRGSLIESRHIGAYCVVENGRVLAARGDVDSPYFMRSAAKPFQALAVVQSGAVDKYQLTDQELALCVGSHNGSPEHAQTAHSIFKKCGESPDLLRCGGHRPLGRDVYEEYIRTDFAYGRLEDNCSGKHAGMVAAAKAWGEPPESYAEEDHRVQRHIRDAVAAYTDVPSEKIETALDGCAVPSFALGVRQMATGISRFVTRDHNKDADRIFDAVQRHPDMVAGEGRFDTRLMRAGEGNLLAKMGAEGVQVVGAADRGLGIAVKILDGGARAVRGVVAGLLRQFDVLDVDHLVEWAIRTRDGEPVGEMRVTL